MVKAVLTTLGLICGAAAVVSVPAATSAGAVARELELLREQVDAGVDWKAVDTAIAEAAKDADRELEERHAAMDAAIAGVKSGLWTRVHAAAVAVPEDTDDSDELVVCQCSCSDGGVQ